jgi:cyanobactin maturation PatA/PatG family protease
MLDSRMAPVSIERQSPHSVMSFEWQPVMAITRLSPREGGRAIRSTRSKSAAGAARDRRAASQYSIAALVPGLDDLWVATRGDARIRIAILDGPIDLSHASLRGANLEQQESVAATAADTGAASRHGTHIASVVFGQIGGPVQGIAPYCRGLSVPIFESIDATEFRACSELDLARAIALALQWGAHVINISGGQFSRSGKAHPLLSDVIAVCARRDVLVVAAAGNDGCACLQLPAAIDPVLAVGAMDANGNPLPFSSWGKTYRTHGVLAPGQAIPGARPGHGVAVATGTSYAAAVVTGISALLLSRQLARGQRPAPYRVRQAMLDSAGGCPAASELECQKFLAGRLNLPRAISFLFPHRCNMSEASDVQASGLSANRIDNVAAPQISVPRMTTDAPADGGVSGAPEGNQAPTRSEEAPTHTCSCKAGRPQLVYALGQIGYDFPSEARLDSIVQNMAAEAGVSPPERSLAFDPRRLLAYLNDSPWDAAAIEWTLNLDGTVLYAIRPSGPFAAEGYRLLRQFLKERLEEGVERISVPGMLAGKATLWTGQVMPVIIPDLRGMYSWTTKRLVEAVVGAAPSTDGAPAERDGHEQKRAGLQNFLERVYHELRNLGVTSEDRAMNYAATNAFEMSRIFESAIQEKMELDHIRVTPSPIGRPGSDCWDVEVYFFYPERQVQTVRKVHRFTVDVSDHVPVTVGGARSWFTR